MHDSIFGAQLASINLGGVLPQKNKKKRVATPKSVNWHWRLLFFFFDFFKSKKLALVFFVFLAIDFARLQKTKIPVATPK